MPLDVSLLRKIEGIVHVDLSKFYINELKRTLAHHLPAELISSLPTYVIKLSADIQGQTLAKIINAFGAENIPRDPAQVKSIIQRATNKDGELDVDILKQTIDDLQVQDDKGDSSIRNVALIGGGADALVIGAALVALKLKSSKKRNGNSAESVSFEKETFAFQV